MRPLKIQFLSEGDARTHDSWSGVSRSVVTYLRELGQIVSTADVDLYGSRRFLTAARTMAWPRKRWWVRYHLGKAGFEARTRRADHVLREAGSDVDLILQIGATFHSMVRPDLPLVLYCDSTITLSRRGASTGHSEAALLDDGEYEAVRGREEAVYRRAHLIFCMSDLLRETFIKDFGISPERLVTVHCAPNTEIPEEVDRSRRSNDSPTVLFVGRDWGRKGGQALLEAFPKVRRQVPGARVLVVGCRPRGTLPSWLVCLGHQSRDTSEGRKKMSDAYRDSDVFCLPTRFEPFGTSFVEAMAYQLPCVGPNAWAVPEIIEHEKTGVLFDPECPSSLADALILLLSDRGRAVGMGRAGRLRALEHFTWPSIVKRMSIGLEGVMKAKSTLESGRD